MGNISQGDILPQINPGTLCQNMGETEQYDRWMSGTYWSTLAQSDDPIGTNWAMIGQTSGSTPGWVPPDHEVTENNGKYIFQEATCYPSGYYHVQQYYRVGATSVPPVANFWCDNVFANPGTTVECQDISTGTPTSWILKLREHDAVINESADYTNPPWTVTLPNKLATWDMILEVSNAAGSNTTVKLEYITTATFNQSNITPITIPTMGFQNITFINNTYYREQINNTLIGNITAPVLDFVDSIGTSITSFMAAVIGYMTYPITLLLGALTSVHTIFIEAISPLIEYVTIPIQITNRVIGVMPWQLVGLITLGLSLDLMYLILRGK
jgi:PKD repeat protein